MSYQLRLTYKAAQVVLPEVFRHKFQIAAYAKNMAFGQGDGVLGWDAVETSQKPTHTVIHGVGVVTMDDFNRIIKDRRKKTKERPPVPFQMPEKGAQSVMVLFRELKEKGISLNKLINLSGISETSLRHWRNGSSPRLDTLEAALNVVGYTLIAVPKTAETNTGN